MTKYTYVVLFGSNGVSEEMTLEQAKNLAQTKIYQGYKPVSIDKLSIYSKDHFSQCEHISSNLLKKQSSSKKDVLGIGGLFR